MPDTRFLPLRSDEPRAVSGYVLEARTGEGGMGTVYLSARPELRPSAAGLADLYRKPSGRGPQDFEARLSPPHAAAVNTAERAARLRLTLPTAPRTAPRQTPPGENPGKNSPSGV
ncbi:hypothetical protein [Streptomyces sp. HUAS TT7]|uniref:hypothetical protein n=1 Tax=Streptomyces sp. HUAS TT7 TaxID=3447507 RepID=UPI003F6567E5